MRVTRQKHISRSHRVENQRGTRPNDIGSCRAPGQGVLYTSTWYIGLHGRVRGQVVDQRPRESDIWQTFNALRHDTAPLEADRTRHSLVHTAVENDPTTARIYETLER